MAVQGQGAARHLPEQPQFGPAGPGDLWGEDPPVQEPAGYFVQAIAVPHQTQGRLPEIAPGKEKAEVGGGFLQKDQIRCAGNHQDRVFSLVYLAFTGPIGAILCRHLRNYRRLARISTLFYRIYLADGALTYRSITAKAPLMHRFCAV